MMIVKMTLASVGLVLYPSRNPRVDAKSDPSILLSTGYTAKHISLQT